MKLKLPKGWGKALWLLVAAGFAGAGTLSLYTGHLLLSGGSGLGTRSLVLRSEDPVWWSFSTALYFAIAALSVYAYFKSDEEYFKTDVKWS